MKLKHVIFLMALFFCLFPMVSVSAEDSTSMPGISIPDQGTLDDLNNAAQEAQDSIDNLTGAVDDKVSAATGDYSTDYIVGDAGTPLYAYTSYIDTGNPLKSGINTAAQGYFMLPNKNIVLRNGLMGYFPN
ncbi:hypothetical protein [Lactococcus protaetiae]|uniref:Uncharacterized protein n=1 Tax=Lactococcus protaetiae TaxID=2592653 RepID=A0A514Z6P2_9LACT|nr:hypothetical protein [Lactococcus protaetiae]QDK70147.1 hypothetical protein FLP15_01840 [Lactococcus protaetiae]